MNTLEDYPPSAKNITVSVDLLLVVNKSGSRFSSIHLRACALLVEEIMKSQEKGFPLIMRVKQRMALEATTVSELAERLHVSQSYVSQLLNGDRSVTAANDDVIRRIAGFLYLPPIVCFVLSGKLELNDFSSCNYDDELRALERRVALIADSTFALESGVSADVLIEADARLLSMIVSMYQALLGPGEMISRRERWCWLNGKY